MGAVTWIGLCVLKKGAYLSDAARQLSLSLGVKGFLMICSRVLGVALTFGMLFALRTTSAQEIEKTESSGPLESEATGTVIGQGLRMRSVPGMNGHIIASLSKGDTLRVASRSSWNDLIDGIRAPWYEVSKGWAAGWCFGGFVSLPADRQIHTSSIPKGSSLPSHSYFENADGTKVGKLPYLNMSITGIEQPLDIPSHDGFNAHYDLTSHYILLEVDKPLTGPIEIRATDPGGAIFRGTPTYRAYSENEAGYKYANPVIGFAFRAPADSYSGKWKLDLYQGRRMLKKYVLSLPTATATLSKTTRPDPFNYPFTVNAEKGDTLFLSGCKEKPNSSLTIAFYRINYEKLRPFNMIPYSAAIIRTDGTGRFGTKFIVGMDLPAGSYKLATGLDKLTFNLFDVYLQIP